MNNSKVTQLLRSFTKQELREFGKFVKSPFHNNRKDVIKFYEALKNYHPDFKSTELTKENIFKKLYPSRKFEQNAIILLSSYLFNLGREFLSISDFKENKFLFKYHYVKSLDKHNADNLFESEYKNTENFLKDENLDTEYFRRKGLLELLKINFNLKRNRQEKTCQNSIVYGDNSIYSFIISFAETYHGLLANKTSFNYDFEDSAIEIFIKNFDFEGFVKDLESKKFENFNYVLYYCYLFLSNRHPGNTIYFSKLKDYSFKDFERLSQTEKSSLFYYLIDYCIYKMEMGEDTFLRESFNLYSEALEKQIFQTGNDKDIGLMFFRNFVTIGLAAKENDYIERFINEYGDKIKGAVKNEVLELSYAMLYYEKKEFDKALECLSRISNAIPLFRLATKYILLKIYYDTGQYESFFSLIDTYRHYLKNDKIIPEHTVEAHTILLNYASRLTKLKSAGNEEDLFILKKEINENMSLDFRHRFWLLEKATELELKNISL